MDVGTIVIVWWLAAAAFSALASWVAIQCGRSVVEGFVLGLLFGPLGVIVESLLPKFPGSD